MPSQTGWRPDVSRGQGRSFIQLHDNKMACYLVVMSSGERADWKNAAACRSKNPGIFHPLPGGAEESRALTTCWDCPVIKECFYDAMRRRDVHGVRGGVPGRDREQLIRAENLRRFKARQSGPLVREDRASA